jgi:hypothetical protein
MQGVLKVDMAGSTALKQGASRDAVEGYFSKYKTYVDDCAAGGVAWSDWMGDGRMFVFADAATAFGVGRRVLGGLDSLNEELTGIIPREARVHIGLHVGPTTFAGSLADAAHEALDIAGHLAGEADPNTMLLSLPAWVKLDLNPVCARSEKVVDGHATAEWSPARERASAQGASDPAPQADLAAWLTERRAARERAGVARRGPTKQEKDDIRALCSDVWQEAKPRIWRILQEAEGTGYGTTADQGTDIVLGFGAHHWGGASLELRFKAPGPLWRDISPWLGGVPPDKDPWRRPLGDILAVTISLDPPGSRQLYPPGRLTDNVICEWVKRAVDTRHGRTAQLP